MQQPGQLTIEVSERADRLVIALAGELDLVHAARLEEVFEDPSVASSRMLVLDLERVGFIDSTGLRAILAVADAAGGRGQRLALTRGSAQVQRLLSVTGAIKHLTTIAGPEEPAG